MTYFEKLFDTFYKKEKNIGLFYPNRLGQNLDFLFEFQKTNCLNWLKEVKSAPFHIKKTPHIHFDYLDSWNLNASASIYSEKIYFIGVNKGTILLLYDLFLKLLSNPHVLKGIGNCTKEVIDPSPDPYPYQATNYTQICAESELDLKNIEIFHHPKDKVRFQYALHLVNLVMDFIIAHETAHILNGHIAYQYKYNSTLTLNEFTENKNSLTNLDCQTLEYNADIFAIYQGINSVYLNFKNKNTFPKEIQNFYNSLENSFAHWLFAVFMFSRIMGPGKNFQPEAFMESSHPPTRIRQLLVQNIMWEFAYLHSEIDYINIENKISGVFWACEETYAEITGNPIITTGRSEALGIAGLKHMNLIRDNWDKMKKNLQPYSFRNLND